MTPLQRLTNLQCLHMSQRDDFRRVSDIYEPASEVNAIDFTALTALLDLNLRNRSVEQLMLPPSTLQSLILNGCHGMVNNTFTASELGALTRIDLGGADLYWSEVVPMLPHTLVHLGLGGNFHKDDELITFICNNLSVLTHLDLRFSGSQITYQGVSGLTRLTRLAHLDLSVWESASNAAFAGLRVPTSLRMLDLRTDEPPEPPVVASSVKHLMTQVPMLHVFWGRLY